MSDPIETTYPIYNQYIYKQGIGWVLVGGAGGDSLPDQTNNAGKFLTTDGTVASWGAVTPASIGALPDDTTAADIGAIPDTHPIMPITQADINKWNSDEVFIATYGTTSKTDVLTAYNAGKAVFVKKESSGLYDFYPLTFYNSSTNIIFFRGVSPNSITTLSLGPGETSWSTESNILVPASRTVNNKALSSNITLSAPDVGAIPDSHVANGITAADISNWNAKADENTDEKLAITNISSGTADGIYYPIIASDSTSAATRQYDTKGLVYEAAYGGKAGQMTGKASLTLGNNYNSATGANKQGILNLYGSTAYKHTMQGTPTADRTLTLPDATGTIALVDDIPTSLSELSNDPGFITTPNIPYFTCGTAVGTAAKTTTLVSGSFGPTDLVAGAQVLVKFTNSNTAGSVTLNVNGTGAKPLRRYGTTVAGTSAASSWQAGAIVLFIYDGSAWVMENWENTTYSTITEAEATAGTSTSSRLVTPALLKKAIQTWAIPINHVVNGITQNDIDAWDAKVSDDHKWNDVALNHTTISSSTIYVPGMAASNSTDAYLFTAKIDPTASSASLYDSNGYLHSTTPSANDASNKVATTDFVSSALSTIEGVPSYGASDTGKVLKTDGVSAYWASIDSLLEYKGVKATAAALPTTGNTTGDVWIVEEDNSEYVWNGTAWEKFGPTIDLSGYVPTSRTINGKALTGNITLNYSDVGALADTVPAAGITNADITAWNNKPSVDEKVKQTPLNGVNSGKGLLFSSSTGGQETTSTAYTSDKLSWNDYGSVLSIYNGSRNKYGYIKYDRLALANSSTSYSGYLQTASVTADRTYTLPDATGTLALTSQIPTSLAELTNDPGYAIITIRDWTSAS